MEHFKIHLITKECKGESLFEEITIQTRHLRLAAKRWPADNDLPVLGLHGWLDNANTFERLAPLLKGVNLIGMDLPGHGKSDHRPAGTRYHYTDYVDDVIAVADNLGWDRFTLLGHSMGAGIGCLVASAYPDRVARLILIEGMGAVTGDLTDVPALLRQSVEAMKPDPSKDTTASYTLEILVRARAAAGPIKRDSAEILVRRSVKRSGTGFRWRGDPQLKRPFPQYFTNEVMLAFLQAIRSPVLLITAQDGMLRKRPYYPSRVKAIKNLQEIMLPGHHHLHLDDPVPVAKAINEYLKTQKDHRNEK